MRLPAVAAPACLPAPRCAAPLLWAACHCPSPRPPPTQGGFLSLLYSIGSKPLQLWDKQVQNGHIKRLTDEDIQSSVLEVLGANVRGARPVAAGHGPNPLSAPTQVSTTFISCPADANETLGIKMPYLVMIIKNMRKYFSFEVTARRACSLPKSTHPRR